MDKHLICVSKDTDFSFAVFIWPSKNVLSNALFLLTEACIKYYQEVWIRLWALVQFKTSPLRLCPSAPEGLIPFNKTFLPAENTSTTCCEKPNDSVIPQLQRIPPPDILKVFMDYSCSLDFPLTCLDSGSAAECPTPAPTRDCINNNINHDKCS